MPNTVAHFPIGANLTPSYSVGDLLIAPPGIQDPRFSESVLLITQTSVLGTQAICLNRSSGHTVNEIIKPLNLELEEDLVLYWGGPVMNNTVWMLHSTDWAMDNTQPVNNEWSITSNMSMFDRVLDNNRPLWMRFMIGIASWGPGQLEMELEGRGPWDHNSSWLVAHSPNPQRLFTLPPARLWRHCCELSGHQAIDNWL